MNELITNNISKVVESVYGATTSDEIKNIIAQLDGVKAMLKAADKFKEEALKFASLEAAVLVAVAEKGMTDEIKGAKRRSAAKWLADMQTDERNKYIEMCKEGLLIEQVWYREVGKNEKFQKAIESANQYKEDAAEMLEYFGVVDTTNYERHIRDKINNPSVANDIINGMRIELRKKGGVGSLHSHVYVVPGKCEKDYVMRAIIDRITGIYKDAVSLRDICSKSGIILDFNDIIGNSLEHSEGGSLYFLCAWLESLGVINDDYQRYITNDLRAINTQLHYKDKRREFLQEELDYLHPEKEWIDEQIEKKNWYVNHKVVWCSDKDSEDYKAYILQRERNNESRWG